ncbi:MAG TPA: biopolymer transporter ExbD [Candidatus Hydrogenedentes bacterium]|nr:biopolymer transporter ExbD [Candidatus Hydrogenedentota bacterium]HIJ74434.1 biopolymer transporter ExbD [Candidatus Hydrogenedentota bacterium]
MKFGRGLQEEAETIQMAPLIDIIFVTLVCFMTTSVYATLEREIDITLPTASSAVQDDRTRGEIYINLKKDGTITISERQVTIAELQDVLNRVAEYFPGGSIIIRGDREAILGNAIAVLDCCKNADIQNVSFAALPPEPEGAE